MVKGIFNIKRIAPKTTIAYDIYWKFATERQKIFFNRLKDVPLPWTNDKIFQSYKFTNAYRASDRVSQYLIRNVIYSGKNYDEVDVFFRIILFKTFNRIETWELLERKIGEICCKNYSYEKYNEVLSDQMNDGDKIYSAAYIMPAGNTVFGYPKKYQNHLKLIETLIHDKIPSKISKQRSMAEVYNTLISYPTIGPFLAYQYCIDLNYSELCNFSEMDFVVPGPGAKSGIRKCFSDFGEYDEKDIIRYVTERQELEFERLGLGFKTLWGRPLQLIDCQNIFCEVDKYTRVALPGLITNLNRTRIKQKFSPTAKKIFYWYPPKWGINQKMELDEGHDKFLWTNGKRGVD